MNENENNKDAIPVDITWALLLFLACIVYAILFQDNNSIESLLNSGLG